MMDQWQIEVAERLARIEANQEYMKSNIRDLPQSPQCIHEITALKAEVTELRTFKNEVKEKIAYIGGVIVVLGLFIPHAIKWVVDHISFKGL